MRLFKSPTAYLLLTSRVVNGFALLSTSTIKPASVTAPKTIVAGAPLQDAERVQLTDKVIDRIASEPRTSKFAEYFAFPNSTTNNGKLAKRAAESSCRTFPGDPYWPKDIIWDVFDDLLGGALIPTVPIGAPCYDTKWGKNAMKCSTIISRTGDPYLQYVDFSENLMWCN